MMTIPIGRQDLGRVIAELTALARLFAGHLGL